MNYHLLDYLYNFVESNSNDFITLKKDDVKNLLKEIDYLIDNYLQKKKDYSN